MVVIFEEWVFELTMIVQQAAKYVRNVQFLFGSEKLKGFSKTGLGDEQV